MWLLHLMTAAQPLTWQLNCLSQSTEITWGTLSKADRREQPPKFAAQNLVFREILPRSSTLRFGKKLFYTGSFCLN